MERRAQALGSLVDNANARVERVTWGWPAPSVHTHKTAQTAQPRAFARSIHAVHVPTDTTVIFHTSIQTRRRRGGAVDE